MFGIWIYCITLWRRPKPDKCQSIIVDGKAASIGGAADVKMR